MRVLSLLLALTALGFLTGCTEPSSSQPAPRTGVAFVNVTLLPMGGTDTLRANQTVLVRGDRIERIGQTGDVEIPAAMQQIDGTNRYLMPGLAEMHGHVPTPSASDEYVEDVLFLYVASGITTVRGMLGAPGQLDLKARTNSGELIAPTLYLAGPSFNGSSVRSPEQARAMVRTQVEQGWDLLKVHPGLSREEYDAMARTANELGIRFGGHVPVSIDVLHALDMGQETFEHIDGYVRYLSSINPKVVDSETLTMLVNRTLAANAWVVPTMALWETLYGTADLSELQSFDELKYMPPAQVEQWTRQFEQRIGNPNFDLAAAQRVIDARMEVLGALHEGGAQILMGTDAPQQFSVPGFSLHRELERMEAAGMPPYDILVTGTTQVGRYFANEDTFGQIAEGHRADLILLEANPLEDLDALMDQAGVMVQGTWIPDAQIQERLAAIARKHD